MKYIELKRVIKKPFFTNDDIRLFGLKVYKYQLNLWQKKGYIIQIKRGLYLFSEYKEQLSAFQLAQPIYSPSYISLESALSEYGLIPEFVPSTTSITTRTTRQFSNCFGAFYFRHLKQDLFWGYVSVAGQYGNYFLAEAEKAVLDYLYLNSGAIKNDSDLDAIRINYEEFNRQIEKKKMLKYAQAFGSKKLIRVTRRIINMAKQNADS